MGGGVSSPNLPRQIDHMIEQQQHHDDQVSTQGEKGPSYAPSHLQRRQMIRLHLFFREIIQRMNYVKEIIVRLIL
jgi:hypothetical protein